MAEGIPVRAGSIWSHWKHHRNEHFGEGNSSEHHQLFLSCAQGGGKREAGKSDFFITRIVLAFLQKTI